MITPFRSSFLAALAFALPLLPVRGAELGDRLANLSTRAQVGPGANVMSAGFVVGEGAPTRVLVRAIGPALAAFSVTGTLNDPVLELFAGRGARLTTNDNWTTADAAAMAGVGAFPLSAGSRDAALVLDLAPGNFTIQVTGTAGATGVALVEIYNLTPTPPLGAEGTFFVASLRTTAAATTSTAYGTATLQLATDERSALVNVSFSSTEVVAHLAIGDIYGRWIPTSSVDGYSSTLATWFGVRPTHLPLVLPNIGRLAKPNLGFPG